jgi:hypothetical protein
MCMQRCTWCLMLFCCSILSVCDSGSKAPAWGSSATTGTTAFPDSRASSEKPQANQMSAMPPHVVDAVHEPLWELEMDEEEFEVGPGGASMHMEKSPRVEDADDSWAEVGAALAAGVDDAPTLTDMHQSTDTLVVGATMATSGGSGPQEPSAATATTNANANASGDGSLEVPAVADTSDVVQGLDVRHAPSIASIVTAPITNTDATEVTETFTVSSTGNNDSDGADAGFPAAGEAHGLTHDVVEEPEGTLAVPLDHASPAHGNATLASGPSPSMAKDAWPTTGTREATLQDGASSLQSDSAGSMLADAQPDTTGATEGTALPAPDVVDDLFVEPSEPRVERDAVDAKLGRTPVLLEAGQTPTPPYADVVEATVAVAQWLGGALATLGAMAGVAHLGYGAGRPVVQ